MNKGKIYLIVSYIFLFGLLIFASYEIIKMPNVDKWEKTDCVINNNQRISHIN